MFSPWSSGWVLSGLLIGGFWVPALLADVDEIIDLFQAILRQAGAEADNVDHPV
jgi:hypothetical protein